MSREVLLEIFYRPALLPLSDLLSFLWLHYVPHVCCPSPLPALFNAQTTAVGESLILTRRNIVSHALHELKGWVKASATPVAHGLRQSLYPLPMET